MSDPVVKIELRVAVRDPELLRAHVMRQLGNWGMCREDFETRHADGRALFNVCAAVYESLILGTPIPDEIGVEIIESRADPA